jgi:hypothetical protein
MVLAEMSTAAETSAQASAEFGVSVAFYQG